MGNFIKIIGVNVKNKLKFGKSLHNSKTLFTFALDLHKT